MSDTNKNSVVRRKGWLRRNLWLIGLLGLLILASWWLTREPTVEADKPLLASIDRGDIENSVTAAGNLQPSTFVDVGAQVSGQLEKLQVEVGDTVEAGQLLAEIDATVQSNRVQASRASIRALEAQLSAREASLKLARANSKRQTRLLAEEATSQADFDSSISTLASAQSSLIQLQSQIAQSEASLASDEATLGFSKIQAPISGTVISINMKEGQTLNASQQAPTILRIADLSTMTVQGEVSEADVSKLNKGMDVYFTTLGSGERRWTGKLRQILPKPTVVNNVVLYTALFDVDNDDGSLYSDMTAQIFFVTASAKNVLRIPVGALSIVSSSGNKVAASTGATERGQGMEGGGRDRGEITDEMREQFRQRREANGGGRGQGGGMGAGRDAEQQQAGNSKATVRVLQADGSFAEQEITVGVSSRVSAEVVAGLNEGDEVVAGIIQARTADEGQGQDRNQNQGFRGGR